MSRSAEKVNGTKRIEWELEREHEVGRGRGGEEKLRERPCVFQ